MVLVVWLAHIDDPLVDSVNIVSYGLIFLIINIKATTPYYLLEEGIQNTAFSIVPAIPDLQCLVFYKRFGREKWIVKCFIEFIYFLCMNLERVWHPGPAGGSAPFYLRLLVDE